MKELSIEEKAKCYDKAIERAKNTIEVNQTIPDIVECVESLFPELKESEDERIRKKLLALIEWSKSYAASGITTDDAKDMIAWLEKQGEQKPDDKVEPKFHEGEWLCENEPNNYAHFIQILEIVNVQGKDRYRISRDIHEDEDVVELGFVEKYYHKFDIQDVKDGDVLASGQLIIIFKKFKEETDWNFVIAYAGIDICGKLQVTNGYWLINNNTKPASKEQRDLLFQKMKESGYEWDAEEKELKKIEQKPVDVRTTGYWHVEDVEQKPAWSKEDDYVIKRLFCLLHNEQDKYPQQSTESQELGEIENKLKSFKDRIQSQSKQEWSEEDEQYLLVCKNALAKYQTTDKWDAHIIFHWLENKLKSLIPQSRWKPSDEQINILRDAIVYVEGCNSNFKGSGSMLENLYNDLKKLREE